MLSILLTGSLKEQGHLSVIFRNNFQCRLLKFGIQTLNSAQFFAGIDHF